MQLELGEWAEHLDAQQIGRAFLGREDLGLLDRNVQDEALADLGAAEGDVHAGRQQCVDLGQLLLQHCLLVHVSHDQPCNVRQFLDKGHRRTEGLQALAPREITQRQILRVQRHRQLVHLALCVPLQSLHHPHTLGVQFPINPRDYPLGLHRHPCLRQQPLQFLPFLNKHPTGVPGHLPHRLRKTTWNLQLRVQVAHVQFREVGGLDKPQHPVGEIKGIAAHLDDYPQEFFYIECVDVEEEVTE